MNIRFNLRGLLVETQNFLVRLLVLTGYRRINYGQNDGYSRLGTAYGGWWLPASQTQSTKSRVLISAGLGHDVSFDRECLNLGFRVIGFDPIDGPFNFACESLRDYDLFSCVKAGVWTENGTQSFFAPQNPNHDSWSLTNSQSTPISKALEFRVISLPQIISDFHEINLADFVMLKMDIEGAEEFVIPTLGEVRDSINFLGAEFDFLALIPFWDFRTRLQKIRVARKIFQELNQNDFKFVFSEGFNFFWRKESSK